MGNKLLIWLILPLFLKYIACDTSEDADVAKLYSIESQIDRLKSLISAQDATIARQLTTIANLRADIAEQNTKIAQQDTTIARQDMKISQQETAMASLRTEINGQKMKTTNQEVENLRQNLENLLHYLNETQVIQANNLTQLGTLLYNMNETQIVQEAELRELGTLLQDTRRSLDEEDRKLNNYIDRCIAETRQLNTTLTAEKTRAVIYNIAAGKPTDQSSTYQTGTSNLALDNNWNGNWDAKSCSHTTNAELRPWWRVDLGSTNEVYVIVIKTRADCCWDRILGAEILVGELQHYEICGTFDGSTYAGEVRIFFCSPLRGRYVKIRQTRQDFLQLCEVAVYGYPLSD